MIRAMCLKLSAALAVLLVAATLVNAQTLVTSPAGVSPVKVAGTQWKGSETLGNFGTLTFQFSENGEAIMIDAASTVGGTYTQNGASVHITFANCVYVGTINGNVMSGNAHFTDGDHSNWTWSVTLQPK
ncbi:MAG TPA: hypothetical protein VE988_12380 [Gemmataceae bacterium]|nr:hypothetical protein [Gemmataceae bacterium]